METTTFTIWIWCLAAIVGGCALWIGMRRSRMGGVVCALFGMWVALAVQAATIGIPVPFSGWEHGSRAVAAVPAVLLFYSVLYPLPLLMLLAVALVVGIRGRRPPVASSYLEMLSRNAEDLSE